MYVWSVQASEWDHFAAWCAARHAGGRFHLYREEKADWEKGKRYVGGKRLPDYRPPEDGVIRPFAVFEPGEGWVLSEALLELDWAAVEWQPNLNSEVEDEFC